MKKFFAEFKEFAMRGNVIDLAVGVIIGAAFKSIVDSLVNDLISPLLGLFGGTDFSNLVLTVGSVQLKYGSFITTVINFVIMAFIIFLLVKALNSLSTLGHRHKKEKDAAPPTPRLCPFCQMEIAQTATRCPHCTSVLEEAASAEEALPR